MSENNSGLSCTLGCWAMAAAAGFLTFVMLLVLGSAGLMQAIFLAGLVFVILGLLFTWLFCSPLPKLGEASQGAAAGSHAAGSGGAGQGAGSKGQHGSASATPATQATAPAEAPAAKAPAQAAATDAPAQAAAAPAAAAAAASKPAAAAATAEIKPSARLAGQEDLAQRKGTWKYEGETNGAGSKSAPKSAPKAAPKAAQTDAGEDYDKDGVAEGTDEGTRPETLSGPRGGKADNLKEIKGIGPKLEKLCNSMGFYHFDQIANWTADEIAWVNANLEGFRGRVTRDQWVEQARILAAGGETEFSKRVEDGDVY